MSSLSSLGNQNKLQMHISHAKFKLAELNWKNLKQSSDLLAEILLTQNKIWGAIIATPDHVYKFMYDKIAEILHWQQQLRDKGIIKQDAFINFVYLDDKDNIVGAWTNIELIQYLSKKSQVLLPEFEVLEKIGKELENTIDPKDKVQGHSVYGMFGGLKINLMGTKLIVNFTYDINHYLQSLGFKVLYGRSSNERGLKLILRYGGEMTAQISKEYKGKVLTLSFVKWNLNLLSGEVLSKIKKYQKANL